MKKNNKIIVVIICLIVAIVGITLLSNNITDSNIKTIVLKFVILLLFYECIAMLYVNYKNKKYSKLPIKQTIGNKIGKTKVVMSDGSAEGLFRQGYQIAKYQFEIKGKIYIKKIYFEENTIVPEKMTLFYRVGKKDIDKEPAKRLYEGKFETFFAIIITIVTYVLFF